MTIVDEPTRPATILLVDDHVLVREAVRRLLQSHDDLRVVGEASSSETAAALAAQERPDVILLDIAIPGGSEAVSQLRASSPMSRIIIVSRDEGPRLVQAAMAAGACGYLLKSVMGYELVVAIRAVLTADDRVVLSVSRESLAFGAGQWQPQTLSERELEVLALAGQALSNKQIAARLSLTEATVKRHMRNIFVKLNAVSRLDAVNKATRDDLAERGGYLPEPDKKIAV